MLYENNILMEKKYSIVHNLPVIFWLVAVCKNEDDKAYLIVSSLRCYNIWLFLARPLHLFSILNRSA